MPILEGKISQMPPAGALSGLELLEVIQNGKNVSVTLNRILQAPATAYDLAVSLGYPYDLSTWLASLHGDRGLSAFQSAQIATGFTGTEAEFVASLKGEKGSIWYGLDTNPDSTLGRIDDWCINRTTLQYFRKLSVSGWTAQGYFGVSDAWLNENMATLSDLLSDTPSSSKTVSPTALLGLLQHLGIQKTATGEWYLDQGEL